MNHRHAKIDIPFLKSGYRPVTIETWVITNIQKQYTEVTWKNPEFFGVLVYSFTQWR